MPSPDPGEITRRAVIGAAATAAFVPISAIRSAAQTSAPQRRIFTQEQRRTLEAFLDRLCPADELGPGALEMDAQNYIEIQLGDYLAPEKQAFLDGLAAVDAYARDLPIETRDEVLVNIDSGKAGPNTRAFFVRVRRLVLEGMFGDPHYGGNKNFAGWDLIKYPGPRLAVSPEMQKMGAPIAPYHRSAWGPEHDGH
jgi:gluconate 2-dehydrogenase gamma chain